MSYIGVQPTAGQYRKLDNISSGFNGSTTSFTTSVSGTNVTAGTAQQLLVSLGGVIQQPDTDYTVSTNTITFTTAPTSGLTFFAVLMGDALNTVTTSDGAITTAKLAGNLSVGLAAGTASAPSLYFTGDTNTGVYSLGADQVAISTGGTGRLFVDASGRVGIGTSSPSYILEVRQDSAGVPVGINMVDTNASGRSYSIRSDAGKLLFRDVTGSADRITLDSSGRVGIGATPSAKLHVNTGTNENLWVGSLGGSGAGVYLASVNDSGSANTPLQIGSASDIRLAISGTEAARIDSSRRLLVGTSTARSNFFNGSVSAALQVEGTGNDTSSLSITRNSNDTGRAILTLAKTRGSSIGSTTVVASGDAIGSVEFQGSDGTEFVQAAAIQCEVDGTPGANDMPGRLVFSTTADGASSPTERMRIKSNGHLQVTTDGGFGGLDGVSHGFRTTTANWVAQFMNDQITGTNNFGVQIKYVSSAPNGTGNSFLLCGDSAADRVQLRSNGGLANYQANNVNLSDRNAKKDIVPATGTWDCIKEWEIVNYRYKDQPDDADLNLGVIAQQVAESCPEVITVFEEATDDKPEKLGVKEQQMYWMAIKALQEAQVRIEQLEASNADLLTRLTALESA